MAELKCLSCIHGELCLEQQGGVNLHIVSENDCSHYKPSADVVEVKHGYWYKHNIKKHGDTLYHCSVCEKIAPSDGGYCWEFTPHCPYCGARMERE